MTGRLSWETSGPFGGRRARPLAAACAAPWLFIASACTEAVPVEAPRSVSAAGAGGGAVGTVSAPSSAVEVVFGDPGLPVRTRDGELTGTGLGASSKFSREFYRGILDEQLSLYPRPLLERIGLKQIVVCKNLSFEGARCAAFADVERGRLYLGLDGRLDAADVARTVHHEVFHQVDFADDHALESDPRWEALNRPEFRYSHDPERLQADPQAMRPDDALEGFLNRYSTSSPAEDKAEVYAYLVVDRDAVVRRAARDTVLRRKVAAVRAALDALGPYAGSLVGR